MKYEFHVGDYVETKCGHIGYISKINQLSNGHDILYICYTDGKTFPCDVADKDVEYSFNRIGQYDFTKKGEGKIEPLAEEYIKSFPIYKTTTTGNDSEWRSIDIGAVSKKINELVEAVNRLEEKVNGN